jgi:hypothetical protein
MFDFSKRRVILKDGKYYPQYALGPGIWNYFFDVDERTISFNTKDWAISYAETTDPDNVVWEK